MGAMLSADGSTGSAEPVGELAATVLATGAEALSLCERWVSLSLCERWVSLSGALFAGERR